VIKAQAYCNVRIYRFKKGDRSKRELVQKVHNLVLNTGLNQIRDALNGAAWHLGAVGLGSNGTAVQATDTWGLTPLICEAPTSSYYKNALFRATFLLEEGDLNGNTLREFWIAPSTTVGTAYSRVVFDPIAKTDDYAYLFIIDCTWGGACTRNAWFMLAALAGSGGAYYYQLNQLMCGRGTTLPTVYDETLADPWTMSPIPVASSVTAVGELTLRFTINPDQFNDEIMREAGLYFSCISGSSPITAPALYCRNLIDPAYAIEVGKGAQVVCVLKWESG